jgi:hypothetical protein
MLVRLLIVWFNLLETTSSSTRWVLRACIAKSTVVVVNLDFLSVPICGPVGFAGMIERWTTFPSARADTPSAAIPAGSFIKPASGAAEPHLFCRRPRSKDTGLWKRTNVETEIHQRCATVLFVWYSSIRANLTTSLLRSNRLRPRSVVSLIRVGRGFVAQTPNQLFMDIWNAPIRWSMINVNA